MKAELTFKPLGDHTSNSTLSTATTLARAAGGTLLLVQAITQNVRLTLDGTTPTASVGFQLKAGDPPALWPVPVEAEVKVIEETASANIQYQWGQA